MDVSLNLIDLQYLTNPDKLTKLMQKKNLQQFLAMIWIFIKNVSFN